MENNKIKTEKKPKNSKKFKATTLAWIMVVLVLCIAVPLNIIADKFDMSFDMTPSKLYSLTKKSTSYLDKLDKDGVKVDFYFLASMDKLKKSDDDIALYNLLKQYSSYDCIKFHSFDPDENPEKVDALNPDGFYNLSEGDILIKCNGFVKKVPSSLMYSYNGSYDQSGNFVATSAYFSGENYITGAIETAVTGYTPTVYFLKGHGEKTIKENYTKFESNLKNGNYDAKELDLSKEKEVPDNTALILIAGPKKDITDSEKSALDKYLDNGGNIAFLLDPSKEKSEFTNIEELMEEFCVKMDYDRVKETDSSLHADGDEYTIKCNLADPAKSSEEEQETENESQEANFEFGSVNTQSDDPDNIDLTSAIKKNGTVTFMPESRSFYVDTKGENLTHMAMNPLITANTSAIGEPYGGTNDDPDTITDSTSGLTLSLYSMDQSRNNAKLVCFGSSYFISDDGVKTDYFINPVSLLLSTISWMDDNTFDMGISAKENTYDSIPIKTKATAQSMMGVLVAIPVVVAAAGILIWLKRRHS